MATSTLDVKQLEPELGSLLARVRRRIWAYVWIEGAVAVALLLGLSFWLSLAFDWVFEPPALLRQIVVGGVAAAAAYLLFRYILRRTLVRLGDKNLALLLERRYRQFGDSLLTTVELAGQPEHAQSFSREMLGHTRRSAVATSSGVDPRGVLNVAPLARRAVLALALLVSVAIFALTARDAFGLWARRSLQFSDELWPRRTHLLVEGFTRHAHVKVARGDDFDLAVKADAQPERLVPELVEIRYEAADGSAGRENMVRQGVAVPGRDDFQQYSFTMRGVLASRSFHVLGGDAREGPFYLDVVDSPTLATVVLHCKYPQYTRRAAADVPVTAAVSLPRGTEVLLRAAANKDLLAVTIDSTVAGAKPTTHQPSVPSSGSGRRRFEWLLGRLHSDVTLRFVLLDADNIRNREPIRLALVAVPDEPPKVDVALRGIGSAITPQARLPLVGKIDDDHGLQGVWAELSVGDAAPVQQPIFQQRPELDAPAPPQSLDVQQSLDVEPLKLEPKQKLQLIVRAKDNFSLPGVNEPPNVGASRPHVLDVVTPEQLRAMLEARELALRRRFEVIVQEFTATRDGLAAVLLSGQPAAAPETKPAADAASDPADKPSPPPQAASAEPGVDARQIQLERAAQNSERAAHETLQVAEAFDAVREELVNNRVDTEELKKRLKDGIADPLRGIAKQSFPELLRRIKIVREKLIDPAASAAARTEAVAQADAILYEMKAVLDKMLELETFNEVLDKLRSIIGEQEKLNDRTKTRQKQKIEDLLK